MQYVKSVQAALRASAPYVAIPVEGHAPACVRAKLLKGALKGVTITSVKIITADPNTDGSGRWLEIKGMAKNGVRTSCKMVVENVKSYAVWKALREWTDRERQKRIKVINQGVLNASERRAVALLNAEKAGIAELIEAKQEEQAVVEEALAGIYPPITPYEPEQRAAVMAKYSEFRAQRSVRKRGSVIRWKLNKLKAEVAEMTKEKREYEERPAVNRFARRRKSLVRCTTVLRRQKDKMRYAALVYQIAGLQKQYNALYPPTWRPYGFKDGTGQGYWIDSFIPKRPKDQAYSVPWGWCDSCVPVEERRDDEGNLCPTRLQRLAARLHEARANIRALTPPETEDEQELQTAA